MRLGAWMRHTAVVREILPSAQPVHCATRYFSAAALRMSSVHEQGKPQQEHTPHVRPPLVGTVPTNPQPVPRAVKERLSKLKPQTAAVFEDVCTVPNLLTIGRIALCPFIGYTVATQQHYLALGLLAAAGTTDLLDGWIARRFNSLTVFGSIADPAADKLLMTTMVVSLSAAGQLPLPLAALIIGRDVYLVIRALYIRYQSLPLPRTWSRYWDVTLPSAQVVPSRVGKFNTFLQLLLVGVLTIYPVIPEEYREHPHMKRAIAVLMGSVAATTIWSGVDYALSSRAVRYLHKK